MRNGIHQLCHALATSLPSVAALGTTRPTPGTVAICFVRASFDVLHCRGVDSKALLEEAGISSSLLALPRARITATQYAEWWRLVSLRLDDEFFGQDSRRMKAGSFAMLCHSVVGCLSLRQGLDRALRFFGLMFDDYGASLEVHAGEARVLLLSRNTPQTIFGQELLIMLIHGVSCWLVGKRVPISRAEFAYAEPAHSVEYRSMFCSELSFNRPTTVFCFPADALNLRIVQNPRTLKEFLRKAPEPILVKYKDRHSFAAKTRKRLRQGPMGHLMTLATLAHALKTTTANLRRRLHDEGTCYRDIKCEVLRDIAIEYLAHSERSVQEVGFELGFSERSAFQRAFKTWTGISPGEFRQRARMNLGPVHQAA